MARPSLINIPASQNEISLYAVNNYNALRI